MYKNKIAGIKKNCCSFSNLINNNYVFYFSTEKMNKKEKLFFMNSDYF